MDITLLKQAQKYYLRGKRKIQREWLELNGSNESSLFEDFFLFVANHIDLIKNIQIF